MIGVHEENTVCNFDVVRAVTATTIVELDTLFDYILLHIHTCHMSEAYKIAYMQHCYRP